MVPPCSRASTATGCTLHATSLPPESRCTTVLTLVLRRCLRLCSATFASGNEFCIGTAASAWLWAEAGVCPHQAPYTAPQCFSSMYAVHAQFQPMNHREPAQHFIYSLGTLEALAGCRSESRPAVLRKHAWLAAQGYTRSSTPAVRRSTKACASSTSTRVSAPNPPCT